jgi:hypothetical protein
MAWIDYKKAFDSVPHSWGDKSIALVGVNRKVVRFCKLSMEKWNTRQTAEQSALIRHTVMYCSVQTVTIPDAVIIQFVLLKMGMLMLETCRGL